MTTQLTFEKLEAIRAVTQNHAITCFVVQTEGMAQDEDYMIKELSMKKGIDVLFLSVKEKEGWRVR